jgi:polyisoprenoid-binding protein YceI
LNEQVTALAQTPRGGTLDAVPSRGREAIETQVLVLLALLVNAASPAPPGGCKVIAAPGASLELEGDSTLRRYGARASDWTVDVGVDAARVATVPQSLDVEGLIRGHFIDAFALVVPVDKLDSGDWRLDRHLRAALAADRHNEIRFRMDSYDIAGKPAPGTALAVTIHGRLTVAGAERPVDVAALGLRVRGGIRFRGRKDLLMTDYGIKPPTLMLGAIKAANRVTVKFDVTLTAR